MKAQQQIVLEAAADYYAEVTPQPATGDARRMSGRDDTGSVDELTGMRTAPVRLTMRIRNAVAGGRGRSKTIRALEQGALDDYAAEKVAPDVYALKVLYEDDDALDDAIEELLEEIRLEAGAHGCVCEVDAQWVGTQRTWTYFPPASNVIPFPGAAAVIAGEGGGVDADALSGAQILRLRVSLQGIVPEIWRRIEVPADIDLAGLHEVIQAAMGWQGTHRYGFGFAGPTGMLSPAAGGASDVQLNQVARLSDSLNYTYDPDEDWRHAIEIEARVTAIRETRYPRCVAGAQACPPEDCGGTAGYAKLVRTLAGPMTDAKRDLLDWLGEPFDPDAFRVADVNSRLGVLRR